MPERKELADARRCLAQAETGYRTAEGLADLGDGLALLDDVLVTGSAAEAKTAANLASTYAGRIYAKIGALVTRDRLPEPMLEHLFKVVLAFDELGMELPQAATTAKIEVVRQLIDRYYEGHPPEKKRQVLEELAQLARRD